MAATATESRTSSPLEGGKEQDPQEFLNGLMRDLTVEGDSVFEASGVRTHEKGSPVTSQGSTIELTEETHSIDHSPRKESERSVEPIPSNQRKWHNVVRKTRGVHNAQKQWRRQAGIKPLDKALKGPNGEALSPEEYSAHRLEMRKRELIGRTIEGELIPREKGKGYFIKWNRWRHDRVFMSAATIESVLGPRPKPGTMIRCTIIRLGPDHVPWNRQNPVANAVEHWFFRPNGSAFAQHHSHNRDNGVPSIRDQKQVERNTQWNRSFSKQEWEYSGICTKPGLKPVYQMPPPSRLSPVSRSRSGSLHGSPVLNGHLAQDAFGAFAERPKGRAEMARTWRSPHMSRQTTGTISRQGTDSSLTSIPPLNLEHSVSSIGPRFLTGQTRSPRFLTGLGRSGSLSEFSQFTRSTTGGTQRSKRSAGSPSK